MHNLGQHIKGTSQDQCKSPTVCPCHQVDHVDKSGQSALVHAGLRGHLDAIHILLGQDWGPETPSDSQLQASSETGRGKNQALQQALTAASSVGHTQVQCSQLLVKVLL